MKKRTPGSVLEAVESRSVLEAVLATLPSDEARLECLREMSISSISPAFQSKPRNAVPSPRTWCEAVSRACSSGISKIGTWLRVAKPERRSDEYDNL